MRLHCSTISFLTELTKATMQYGYKKQLAVPFDDAVEKTKAALAQEDFGVLTEIDVQATLKKKLEIDYGRYVIIGACNPPLAHQALAAEKEIGLLLPCNVIVYEDEEKVFVSAILPTAAMSVVDNLDLSVIATEVEGKLQRAIDSLTN